ncbi:MAG TPA: phosphodiester glycosidase family protein [Geminocystis sp. M7585_C2015_104]|nr:phosphodiester glycosidase family protein [Geminocystis sp. M7585_C2015_104]
MTRKLFRFRFLLWFLTGLSISGFLTGFNGFNLFLSPPVYAQNYQPVIQGKEVIIGDRRINLPWMVWQDGSGKHFGLADMAAESLLGIELNSSFNPQTQSVSWFNFSGNIPVKFVPPFRYIDVTNIFKNSPIFLEEANNTLLIKSGIATVEDAYESADNWGRRIVIQLSQPALFQVTQGRGVGIITIINSQPSPKLISPPPSPDDSVSTIKEEEGNETNNNSQQKGGLFTISVQENNTIISVNLPEFHNLRVTTSSNNVLQVDIRKDAIFPRDISWHRDIFYSRRYVGINNNTDYFLVSYITINPRSSQLKITPILPNQNTVIGTESLKRFAESWGIIAGINGGFFNRNNQLPLGAIKYENEWLSSPILNRGVFAWDKRGGVKFSRLQLVETISIGRGDKLTNYYINSGYIQSGLARYTPRWGNSYTPLSNGEIVVVVRNDRVEDKIISNNAGDITVNIPENGYLLVFRKAKNMADKISIGDRITITTNTIPENLINYPYIVGAGPLLLLNNRAVLNPEMEKFNAAFANQKASRSVVAVDKQGRIMLVAVHNRIGGVGPNLLELTEIMRRMGAVSALNLDGGSSTQLYLGGAIIDRSPETAARIHNGIGIFPQN